MQSPNCELCFMEYKLDGKKPLSSCLRCETAKEIIRRKFTRKFKKLPAKYRTRRKVNKSK